MPKVKLVIEYDGSEFYGWQSQKEQPSIQDSIEGALSTIFGRPVAVTGAGRTDSGVHARNQVAHLSIPEHDTDRLRRSLNGLLPSSIAVKKIEECKPDFHARYDAISRRYRYYISRVSTAVNRNFVWQLRYPLNLVLMQRAATRILSVTDFRSFCKARSEVKHHRCRIISSCWFVKKEILIYEVTANRFLHGMVRALVGTQIELGRGKITWNDFERMIRSKDRNQVPFSAPAKGLFLEEVRYE